jgi:hypothetical protein
MQASFIHNAVLLGYHLINIIYAKPPIFTHIASLGLILGPFGDKIAKSKMNKLWYITCIYYLKKERMKNVKY